MKLEALQGFLRVNPQNTVNDVSLQGKKQRRKKKRQSALSKARSTAKRAVRQKVSGARQAVRQKASSLQVPARVAAIRQKRQMNGGSIKNAIGGMEMSVNDMLMQPGTGRGILDGNMYGSLNGPGRAARKAARAAKKQARQAKRQDRKKKTADRRASRSTRRDERLAAKQQRQATREERQQGRQDKKAERQDARAARRLERQESRQEAKRLRQEQRQLRRNERRGDGGVLRDVFGNITETAGEIFGGGDDGGGFFSEGGAGAGFAESFEDATGFDFPLGQDDPESSLRSGDGEPIEDESSLPIVPIAIGAAVVGYIALSGKGKKGKRKKRK